MHVQIYRYEDVRGLGPYRRTGGIGKPLLEEHNNSRTQHPIPHEEGMFLEQIHVDESEDAWKDIRFGCKSLESLHVWFKGFHHLLRSTGYRIRVYEAQAQWVLHGFYQVAFNGKKARILHEI